MHRSILQWWSERRTKIWQAKSSEEDQNIRFVATITFETSFFQEYRKCFTYICKRLFQLKGNAPVNCTWWIDHYNECNSGFCSPLFSRFSVYNCVTAFSDSTFISMWPLYDWLYKDNIIWYFKAYVKSSCFDVNESSLISLKMAQLTQ